MEYEIESTMGREVNEGIGPTPDIYKRNFIDLEDAVTTFKKSSKFLVDAVDIPDDKGEEIAEGIRNRTAKAVSDGSFLPEHKAGAAAFRIYGDVKAKQVLEGRTFVTGEAEIQSAYRSELSGIDGCLTLIEILVKVYNIQEGEVEIALDSQSALNQVSESEYLCALQTSFDILQDIRGRLQQLPIDIKWKWVEGHQDEKGKKLDWWARQNQKVDLSAKDFVQNAIKYEY